MGEGVMEGGGWWEVGGCVWVCGCGCDILHVKILGGVKILIISVPELGNVDKSKQFFAVTTFVFWCDLNSTLIIYHHPNGIEAFTPYPPYLLYGDY